MSSMSSQPQKKKKKKEEEVVVLENSRSVAGRELPPIPESHIGDKHGSILLFYQYKEPEWTSKEHKKMLKQVLELAGTNCQIQGRGRIAPEGLNCTLSGDAERIRTFCLELRKLNPQLFQNTDFKITDCVPKDQLFKSLSLRKTKELVAYGLDGSDKAPSLSRFAGEHLEAHEYHQAMQSKDTVIVDVRNYYESSLGNFCPPEGGAQLLDPKMRNSIEFPKWLADPTTQRQLNNKKVLMYCTGGIRCERATALLNQMSAVTPEFKPKGVYELQGGIERYVKTFPEGGFWKGKNYLFDRRMEQLPSNKTKEQVEQETSSKCVACGKKWTIYRGKFKCSQGLCAVPVIVCDSCKSTRATKSAAGEDEEPLMCQLCQEGYKAPQLMPDLVSLKRKAAAQASEGTINGTDCTADDSKKQKANKRHKSDEQVQLCKDRLFLARLPLNISKAQLSEALNDDKNLMTVHWLTDKQTKAFYGSCIVQLSSADAAQKVMTNCLPLSIQKKKIKVSFARHAAGENDVWPPPDYQDREFPPIGS